MSTQKSSSYKREKTAALNKPFKKTGGKTSSKRAVKKTLKSMDSTDEIKDHKKPGTAAGKKSVETNSKKRSKLKPVKKNIASKEKIFEKASAEEDSSSEIKEEKRPGTAAGEKPSKTSADM